MAPTPTLASTRERRKSLVPLYYGTGKPPVTKATDKEPAIKVPKTSPETKTASVAPKIKQSKPTSTATNTTKTTASASNTSTKAALKKPASGSEGNETKDTKKKPPKSRSPRSTKGFADVQEKLKLKDTENTFDVEKNIDDSTSAPNSPISSIGEKKSKTELENKPEFTTPSPKGKGKAPARKAMMSGALPSRPSASSVTIRTGRRSSNRGSVSPPFWLEIPRGKISLTKGIDDDFKEAIIEKVSPSRHLKVETAGLSRRPGRQTGASNSAKSIVRASSSKTTDGNAPVPSTAAVSGARKSTRQASAEISTKPEAIPDAKSKKTPPVKNSSAKDDTSGSARRSTRRSSGNSSIGSAALKEKASKKTASSKNVGSGKDNKGKAKTSKWP